ncbi:MAG: FAD-dependent oxidoreductase, partial [Lactobacillaceae bacterium]
MIEYKNVDGYDLQNIKPSKVIQTDVLVVGAGNAGMMAAAAAKEHGAQVVLIEKEKTINLIRVGIASVSSNAQKRAGTVINKTDLVESLAAFAQHNVDEKLLKTWADNSSESVNWLEDNILKPHGAHFRSEPDAMVTSKAYQGFPTENDPTIDDQSFVSYGDWFVDYQKKHGVEIRYQTALVGLHKSQDVVSSAIVKDLKTNEFYEIVAKKGIILTTGGYSANKSLLSKW